MVSQKITTKGKKMLTEEIGEQMIFDDVMAGMPIVRVAKKYNVGTRVFYAWLHDKKEPERWRGYWEGYQNRVIFDKLKEDSLKIYEEQYLKD